MGVDRAGVEDFRYVGWGLLDAWMLSVCMSAMVLPHELGHALAGRALGVRIFSIRVGSGRPIFEGRLFGMPLTIRSLPFGGATVLGFQDRSAVRLKHWLISGGGPAVNAVFLAASLPFALRHGLGRETVLSPSLALVLAAGNAVVLATNLWPQMVRGQPTDGLFLLRAPFYTEADVERILVGSFVVEADILRGDGRLAEARRCLEGALATWPDQPFLRADLGLTQSLMGEHEAARAQFLAALGSASVPPTLTATLKSAVAWADLAAGPQERLAEADQLSREALEAVGWDPSIKGVRGGVLVEQGRTEAGLKLLQDALRDADTIHPMARATFYCYMAMVLAGQGKLDEARPFLDVVLRRVPSCPFLPRAQAAFAAGWVASAS